MELKPFASWFNQKYLDWWQKQKDRKANVTSFAKWLQINRASVSHYLNGKEEPQGDYLYRIAVKLGFEVYDILGYTSPDLHIREWQALYELTPPDLRDDLIAMNKDWLKKKGIK